MNGGEKMSLSKKEFEKYASVNITLFCIGGILGASLMFFLGC